MTLLTTDVPFWSAPLGSDVPMGEAPPTVIYRPGPIDHQQKWLLRVLTQFRSSPELLKLIHAPLGASTVLEGVFWTLLTITLANAVGVQLDAIGARFNFARDGLSDDDYRALIPIWVQACRSSGTTPQIVALLDRLDPDNTFVWDDLADDPDSFSVLITDPPLSDAEAEKYQRFVRRARAHGIRVWLESYPADPDTLFTFASADDEETDAARGFDAGGLAREVIA